MRATPARSRSGEVLHHCPTGPPRHSCPSAAEPCRDVPRAPGCAEGCYEARWLCTDRNGVAPQRYEGVMERESSGRRVKRKRASTPFSRKLSRRQALIGTHFLRVLQNLPPRFEKAFFLFMPG